MDHPAVVLFDHTLEIAEPDINRALLGKHNLLIIRNCADRSTSLSTYCRDNEYHGCQHDNVSNPISFYLSPSNSGIRLFSFVRHLGRQKYLSFALIIRQVLLTVF